MELEAIVRELEKSDRWGVNWQPHLGEFANFLVHVNEEVGLEEVEVIDRDYVYFRTHRPLTPQLAFELGRMMVDGLPETIDNEQVEFKLWWD